MKKMQLVTNLPKGAIITIQSLYMHGKDNKYYSDGTTRTRTSMGEGYWLCKIDRKGRDAGIKEFITIKQLMDNNTIIEVPDNVDNNSN